MGLKRLIWNREWKNKKHALKSGDSTLPLGHQLKWIWKSCTDIRLLLKTCLRTSDQVSICIWTALFDKTVCLNNPNMSLLDRFTFTRSLAVLSQLQVFKSSSSVSIHKWLKIGSNKTTSSLLLLSWKIHSWSWKIGLCHVTRTLLMKPNVQFPLSGAVEMQLVWILTLRRRQLLRKVPSPGTQLIAQYFMILDGGHQLPNIGLWNCPPLNAEVLQEDIISIRNRTDLQRHMNCITPYIVASWSSTTALSVCYRVQY